MLLQLSRDGLLVGGLLNDAIHCILPSGYPCFKNLQLWKLVEFYTHLTAFLQKCLELLLGEFAAICPQKRCQILRSSIELFAASHTVVFLDVLHVALPDTNAFSMEPRLAILAHHHYRRLVHESHAADAVGNRIFEVHAHFKLHLLVAQLQFLLLFALIGTLLLGFACGRLTLFLLTTSRK